MAKTNRKHGRHKTRSPSAKTYLAEGRRLKNKLIKLAKHIAKHKHDSAAATSRDSLKLGKKGSSASYRTNSVAPHLLKQHLANKRWKQYVNGVL